MKKPAATAIAPPLPNAGNAAFSTSRIRIPLKFKFLGVLLMILLTALGVFLYVAQRTFAEDKKLFVMDLNLSGLKATTSELKMEIKSRLEELQVFVPRIYLAAGEAVDPYQGLSSTLRDELVAISFFRREGTASILVKQYVNQDLLKKKGIDPNLPKLLSTRLPPQALEADGEGLSLYNRSQRVNGKPVGILTFQINGTFIGNESKNLGIIVDFSQDFLRKRLQSSDLAEQFLIFKRGTVLSHPSLDTTVDYADKVLPHPVVERLKSTIFPRESLELEVDGEPYLTNIAGTGFADVFAVSQTRKSEAFIALRLLFEKTLLLAAIILSSSVIVSVFFATRLTNNIKKLRDAAQRIGSGQLDTKVSIRSKDEIQNVAESFQWMTNRLRDLIVESTEKARLEDELETARLVQSTILSPPTLNSDAIEVTAHYVPASQCGGDYWDAYLHGNLLTVFIGDATGHGAPAAIVTAVAKSCFNTLNSVFVQKPLTPDQFLVRMNRILYGACRGKLLMTMCVYQLNTETGELWFANAGHESPLLLSNGDTGGKKKAEVLFSRGERLGFNPDEKYTAEKRQLGVGDILLLYTDGISEARDPAGKEWGERALKKTFALGGNRPLNTVKKEIVTSLEIHTKNTPQADDVTFVLASWKKAAAPVNPNINQELWMSNRGGHPPPLVPGAAAPHAPAAPPHAPPPVPKTETGSHNTLTDEEKAQRAAFLYQGRSWNPPRGGGQSGNEAA